jgi:hypothetical protein
MIGTSLMHVTALSLQHCLFLSSQKLHLLYGFQTGLGGPYSPSQKLPASRRHDSCSREQRNILTIRRGPVIHPGVVDGRAAPGRGADRHRPRSRCAAQVCRSACGVSLMTRRA